MACLKGCKGERGRGAVVTTSRHNFGESIDHGGAETIGLKGSLSKEPRLSQFPPLCY